jgi:hypothetical protein
MIYLHICYKVGLKSGMLTGGAFFREGIKLKRRISCLLIVGCWLGHGLGCSVTCWRLFGNPCTCPYLLILIVRKSNWNQRKN